MGCITLGGGASRFATRTKLSERQILRQLQVARGTRGDRALVVSAGEHALKGFSKPQRAFEVERLPDVLKPAHDRTSGAA